MKRSKHICRVLIFAVIVFAFLSGCSSTRIIAFEQFANTGDSYTQALDQVLESTGSLAIRVNSLELLENRALAPVSREDFRKQDAALKDLLNEIALLRNQARRLREYFAALKALAGSDAPKAFAAEAERAAVALAGATKAINDESKISAIGSVVGSIGKLVMSKIKANELEKELQKRKETITEVLALQEKLLDTLRGIAEDRQQFLDRRTYRQVVERPFLSSDPIPSEESWIEARESGLRATSLPDQLAQAAVVAQRLRLAWQKLLTQELGQTELSTIAGTVEELLIPASR